MNDKRRTLTIVAAALIVGALSLGGGILGARLAGGRASSADLEWGATGTPGVPNGAPDYEITPAVSTAAVTSGDEAAVAHSFQQQFRNVAAQTLPVVVEVNVVNSVTREAARSPFEFFFGPLPDDDREEREFRQQGMGSGVIVARDGDTVYVVSNHHVAGDADEIEIVLTDGREYMGGLVGSDELLDLALLSFETDEDVPIAPLGDSEALKPGDWVFAVGNPLGFQSSITAGIVSATARAAQPGSQMSGITDYIQTDAAINRGNSGGPLVNLDGEVVGINTWIASQTGGSIGLGFAIPINNTKRAIEDFISEGSVAYSWLGVQVSSLSSAVAEGLDIDAEAGAFVAGVYDESPAEQSGLLPGDVILRIGDVEIDSSNTLVRTVANLEPGERIPMEVIRGGDRMTVMVRTGRRTAESGTEAPVWPGVSVAPLTDEVRERLDLGRTSNGVVIAGVDANSPAADSGLRAGDTITAVNGTRVRSLADFYEALADVDGDEVQFRIVREGRQIILGFVRPSA
ncbi:MAG: Do family serine endopeptidase [Spirochaetota bacterium]